MKREIQKDDIGRVEEIWYQESVRVHNWMDNPEKFWSKRRKDFQCEINKSDEMLVFDENKTIKGFILKWPNNYIPELFVDHQHRAYPNGKSKEIGRTLVDYLKDSNSALTASVYMLNHNAIKFYIKNDFIITKLYTEKGTGFTKFIMEWKTRESHPV